jgi:hypothetical protein
MVHRPSFWHFFVLTYWNKGLRKVAYIQTKELRKRLENWHTMTNFKKSLWVDIAAHSLEPNPISSRLFGEWSMQIWKFWSVFRKITEMPGDGKAQKTYLMCLDRRWICNYPNQIWFEPTIERVIEDHQKGGLDKGVKIILK